MCSCRLSGGRRSRSSSSAWEERQTESSVVLCSDHLLIPVFLHALTLCYPCSQNTTHPAINILLLRAEPMMRRFYNQEKDFSTKP